VKGNSVQECTLASNYRWARPSTTGPSVLQLSNIRADDNIRIARSHKARPTRHRRV